MWAGSRPAEFNAFEAALTNRDDEEADVAQPIGRLAGQLFDEAAEDGAKVSLVSAHRHLHGGRSLGVTVTAGKHIKSVTDRFGINRSIISYHQSL